jgi:RHS repeat-associated protein
MGFGGGSDPFGYTDDGDGRLLNDGAKSYLWEMQGWLCGVTSAGNHYQYIYDAEGRLVTTASRPDANCALGTTTLADYVVDQFGRQITEADGSANWRHTNVYANGELLATYDGAGLHYALNDWLGDKRVQALASSTGTTVEETCWNLPFNDGFGCSGTGTDATEQHYTGKEHDKYASQLDHLGARSYTGYSARFLSPDPTQLYYADPANPQSFNLYSYVRNNPLANIDPTGLDCENGEGMDLGQGGGDHADPSQWDYHSSQSECETADENGNSGQWTNDAYTHPTASGDWADDDNRPELYTMGGTAASVVTPQFAGQLATDSLLSLAAGVTDVALLVPNAIMAITGVQRTPILRLFSTHHCGPGGAGSPNGGNDPDCQTHDDCFGNAGLNASANLQGSGVTMSAAQMSAATACNQALYNSARSHPGRPGSASLQYWLTGQVKPFGFYTLYPGTEAKP